MNDDLPVTRHQDMPVTRHQDMPACHNGAKKDTTHTNDTDQKVHKTTRTATTRTKEIADTIITENVEDIRYNDKTPRP